MKTKIIENIENSEQLEKLFRADPKGFEKDFFEIYPEIATFKSSDFWKIRLAYEHLKEDSFKIKKQDIIFLIITCVITGFLIQIPNLFDISLKNAFFYEKNAGLIVLFGLSVFTFLTKEKINTSHALITFSIFLISFVYINLLPLNKDSQSIILTYIHLPLMVWCVYGLIFIDFDLRDKNKRIDFIKYNGDLAVLLALISIAGGILTGVTIGLFSAIDINIEQFYFDYIVVWGLVSAPIVAAYVVRNFPFVVNKIAPVIANIFSPLVLITLIVYLLSIVIKGKDPYNDRDFLIIFNLMLLGVMGIVVFSISETSINRKQHINEMILFALSIVTLIINLVAISAILYRLGEYGFTPNRTVVLGSNLLIFGNLVLITIDLYKVNFKNKPIKKVELIVAEYLPIYVLWTIFVVFVLPFIFALK